MSAPQHAYVESTVGDEAVHAALMKLDRGRTVSTRAVIGEIRSLSPDCDRTDAELVEIIVDLATSRHFAVVFDQRG